MSDFKENVIKIFRTPDEGKRGNEMRIVQWGRGNQTFAPRLEIRDVFWDSESGEKRYGKAKGFLASDVTFIINNKDEIMKFLIDIPFTATKEKIKKAAERSGALTSQDVQAGEAASDPFAEN